MNRTLTEQNRASTSVFILALLVVIGGIYWQVRSFEFLNFDDNIYVSQNSFVNQGLTWQGLRWAFSEAHGGHWHPLSWISHMIDCEIFGLNPGAHHLVNVAFHALNALLLFLLVQRFRVLSSAGSFFISLIFALHPLRLESVAWITERKDVLSLFFMLISLHGYIWYVRATRARCGKYLFSLVALSLALLAKPSAVVLPALFLLLDWWPLKRDFARWGNLLAEKIPFVLVVLGCSFAAVFAQGEGGGLKSLADYPLIPRIATVFAGYSIYLGKLFFPTGQGIFYPYQLYQPGVASGAALLLILISIFCVSWRKERPYLLFGWGWFLISLVPVIGIVQVGGQSYADRWSYLPHIGLLLSLSLLWQEFGFHRFTRWIATTLVFICGMLTFQQLPHWRSSEAIFRHTLEVAPENFMSEMNLGVALRENGKEQEAHQHFENAVLLRPFYPDALNNLAISKLNLGRLSEAESLFRRAIASNPASLQLRANLIQLLVKQQMPGAALDELVISLKIDFNNQYIRQQIGQLASLSCEQFESGWHAGREIRDSIQNWPVPQLDAVRRALIRIIECGNNNGDIHR